MSSANILIIAEQVCAKCTMTEVELCQAELWSYVKQVGKKCTPGKTVNELCVGLEWVAAKEALDAGGAGKVKVVEEYAKKVRYVFFCAKNLIID